MIVTFVLLEYHNCMWPNKLYFLYQNLNLATIFFDRIEASKQTPGVSEIRKQALMSGGNERLAGPSKALVPSDKMSSSAIVQKRALTMPKPEWHAPWKLMRVRLQYIYNGYKMCFLSQVCIA